MPPSFRLPLSSSPSPSVDIYPFLLSSLSSLARPHCHFSRAPRSLFVLRIFDGLPIGKKIRDGCPNGFSSRTAIRMLLFCAKFIFPFLGSTYEFVRLFPAQHSPVRILGGRSGPFSGGAMLLPVHCCSEIQRK